MGAFNNHLKECKRRRNEQENRKSRLQDGRVAAERWGDQQQKRQSRREQVFFFFYMQSDAASLEVLVNLFFPLLLNHSL